MKRLISFVIIIAILVYGIFILINYVQLIVRKEGLEEKAKESVEFLHTGTSSYDRIKTELFTHITENNINVDTMEVKIEKNPQFTYIYIPYYDSLVFPLFKFTKIIYFDYEIAETLYVK